MPTDHDDPFDRAVRRASLLERLQRERDISSGDFLPFIGVQAAWSVLLAVHLALSSGDGLFFDIHLAAYIFGLGFTVMMFFLTRDGSWTWPVLGPAVGWTAIIALHAWHSGADGALFAVHISAWGLALAMSLFAFLASGRSSQ